MQGEKKRKGRGKKITSALGLLDNEPYRTIIDVINYLEEAEPQQIRCVINNEDEENLKLDHIHNDLDSVGRWVNSKEEYKRKTREVKQLIQSRPDKPLFNPFTSANIRDYLDKLIEWRIVEKIERRCYQIAPSLKNEIIRKSNTRIIDSYARDDISDFTESNLIVYGFEHLCKQLEEADRSESGQKLASKLLVDNPDMYYWFSISSKCEEVLNKGIIPEELQEKFKSYYKREYGDEISFPVGAIITKEKGKEWIIDDGLSEYFIRKEDGELGFYESLALERRTGKDYITKIKERLEDIEYELEALQIEAWRAVCYLESVNGTSRENYLNDLKKYAPFDPPGPLLSTRSNISLFYSEKLGFNLPSSIDLEISVSRWHRALIDKTLSEKEREKIAKELFQKHGEEIIGVCPTLRYYIKRTLRKKKE